MNVLENIVKEKLYCFCKECSSWEEAIKQNANPLIKNNYVNEEYVTQVVECIKKYGPYIIVVPNVAMPHSSENAAGIFKTGIAFMKVEKPVIFDKDDPEKKAQLFFMVASENGDKHIENIQGLCEIFEDEELLKKLAKLTDEKGLKELIKEKGGCD